MYHFQIRFNVKQWTIHLFGVLLVNVPYKAILFYISVAQDYTASFRALRDFYKSCQGKERSYSTNPFISVQDLPRTIGVKCDLGITTRRH